MTGTSARSPVSGPLTLGIENQALEVMGRLQSAFGALIEATPGVKRRPADLCRTLGIHNKLAWQVHRVAHSKSVLSEAGHVPGPAAMDRFLDAAAKRGVPDDCIAAVRTAQREYEELIKAHAASRGEFDSIVSGLAEGGTEQVDRAQRRAAFKAQSHILGVYARTHLAMYIFRPSESNPELLDTVVVRGLIGLRRSRRDAYWTIATMRIENDDGSAPPGIRHEPVAPMEESRGVGLLPKFCTRPLPDLKHISTSGGGINVVVEPNGLGAKSSITCLVGHIIRDSQSRYRDEHNTHESALVAVRTPCEVLIQDVLAPPGLFAPAPPRVYMLSDHRIDDQNPMNRAHDRLPMREEVWAMGQGLRAIPTPEVPHHRELVKYVFDRIGWNVEEFCLHRCRMEYPVMPSSVIVQFDLAAKPGRPIG